MRWRHMRLIMRFDLRRLTITQIFTEECGCKHNTYHLSLTRVTSGAKPLPDMASFVMLKLVEEYKDKAPNAAQVLQHDNNMDELIHSSPTQSHEVK